jgi:hypothetical protein
MVVFFTASAATSAATPSTASADAFPFAPTIDVAADANAATPSAGLKRKARH